MASSLGPVRKIVRDLSVPVRVRYALACSHLCMSLLHNSGTWAGLPHRAAAKIHHGVVAVYRELTRTTANDVRTQNTTWINDEELCDFSHLLPPLLLLLLRRLHLYIGCVSRFPGAFYRTLELGIQYQQCWLQKITRDFAFVTNLRALHECRGWTLQVWRTRIAHQPRYYAKAITRSVRSHEAITLYYQSHHRETARA